MKKYICHPHYVFKIFNFLHMQCPSYNPIQYYQNLGFLVLIWTMSLWYIEKDFFFLKTLVSFPLYNTSYSSCFVFRMQSFLKISQTVIEGLPCSQKTTYCLSRPGQLSTTTQEAQLHLNFLLVVICMAYLLLSFYFLIFLYRYWG